MVQKQRHQKIHLKNIYKNAKLKMMYSNADGLVSKLCELRDLITKEKPEIVCLTETKLNATISNATLNFDGYEVWRKDRESKPGGGVMILTKKDLKVTAANYDEVPNKVELVAVDVMSEEGDLTVATLYMPPKTRAWEREEHTELEDLTIKRLNAMLQIVEGNCKRTVLTGDSNSNIDWKNLEEKSMENSWNHKILEIMYDFVLAQHIEHYTRVRGTDNPSLLDLLFTRNENEVENIEYNSPLGKSDHVVLKWNYIVAYDILEYEERHDKQYNFKRGNYKGLKEHFKGINWEEELNLANLNDQYEQFCDIYSIGVNKFMPHKSPEVWRKK